MNENDCISRLICERKFHVTFAPGSESYMELSLPGAKVLGNETSKERKFRVAKVPPMVLSGYFRSRKYRLWYFRSWERKYVGTKVP